MTPATRETPAVAPVTPALPLAAQDRAPPLVRLGYYLGILLPLLAYLGLANLKSLDNLASVSWHDPLALSLWIFLIFPIANSVVAITGLLYFGPPRDRKPGPQWRWDPDVRLIVAYVSRGNNSETLRRATAHTQSVLDDLGVNYTLEVVTDMEICSDHRLAATGGEVLYYVVPASYQTPRRARYKARALQYLLEQRTARLSGREDAENVWILHMDEESLATPESVLGIREHIEKYDLRRTPGAIGQGEILYNSLSYGDNMLIVAIDAARSGGDLGIFRMQYKATHCPLVGMHGSYVLTPARIEREITWDVGGHGSITEDAYFALVAMDRGVTFDWVEGFIREQSPFTLLDLLKQRRRWFCGLSHIARDPAFKFRTTLTLKIQVFFSILAALVLPLPLVYLQQRFMFGNNMLPYSTFLLAAACSGVYSAMFIIGAYRNVLHCDMPLSKKLWIVLYCSIAWFFFIPALAECLGLLYGLFFPVTTFYVVAKDAKPAPTAAKGG